MDTGWGRDLLITLVTVWAGSLPAQTVTSVIRTVDLQKRDSEMKILLSCTPEEAQQILEIHNGGTQAAILVNRPL
jgi:inorganic pyrophosphatase